MSARTRAAATAAALAVGACTPPRASAPAPPGLRGAPTAPQARVAGKGADGAALPPRARALWRHWTPPAAPGGQSLALVTAVVNAARERRGSPPLAADEVLAGEVSGTWRRQMVAAPGPTLDQVALFALQSLWQGGHRRVAVEVVRPDAAAGPGRLGEEQALVARLTQLGGDAGLHALIAQAGGARPEAPAAGGRAAAVGLLVFLAAFEPADGRVLLVGEPDAPAGRWLALPELLARLRREDPATGQARGYVVIREP